MNILYICTFFPFPPNEGIKTPEYNLIKEFYSLGHNVYLLSFIQPDEERYLNVLEKFCKKIFVVKHKISKANLKRVFYVLFGKYPFNVYQFYTKKFLNMLNQILLKEKLDILFFDFFTTAKYFDEMEIKKISVLHYHDAVSMLFYRNFITEKNLVNKLYWFNQYKKLLRFEFQLQNWFEKIIVVAQKDKDWLCEKAKIHKDKIEVIPNGVDSEYFYFKHDRNFVQEPKSLLFRGIMNFKPNIDACLYFLEKIWPELKVEIPEVKFYVVGPNPPKQILEYSKKDKNIIITGYVDDIREYIAKSEVNICPMVSGSGIKNKILESLAMGTPSVVTSIAAEGIPELKDGVNVLIADTPTEFIKKIKLLFEDKQLYKTIAVNGRRLVEESYTWKKVAERFCQIFEEVVSLKSQN